MALTLDASARIPATANTSDTSNPVTGNFTCPAGTEMLVLGICIGANVDRAGGAPTYNGVAMTQRDTNRGSTTGYEAGVEVWELADPPTGSSYAISIPNTGGKPVWAYVAAIDGGGAEVDYDTAAGEEYTGTSTDRTVSITTGADGCFIFAVLATGDNAWGPTGWTGTQLYDDDCGSFGGGAQYYVKASAGAQDISWTGDATGDDVAMIAVSYKPVSSGTTYNQVAAGAITPSGAIAKQGQKADSGALTPAGTIAKLTAKSFAGGLTPAGIIARLTGKPIAGSLTPAGALAAIKIALLSIGGALTPSGTLAKQAGKSLAGSLAPAGALIRQTAKAIAGVLTPMGAAVKQTNKPAAGSLTPSGALSGIKIALMAVGGTLLMAGTLARQAGKAVAGSLAPSGGLVRSTSKALSGALTAAGTLVRQTSKALAGSLTPSGGITKQISKALTGALNWVGTLATVLSGGTPVTDWVMLTLHPRTDDLTLDTRSASFTVAARTDDLTLNARADDLTLHTRSASLTVETRE